MHAESWRTLLRDIAAGERVKLTPERVGDLRYLQQNGLVEPVPPPRQESLDLQFETLQARHRIFLEAKGLLDRLQRRCAPRSRFAGLIPVAGPERPHGDDPEVQRLFTLLQSLHLHVREVDHPAALLGHLDRIRDHLQVEDRDCLDRMAHIDRELSALAHQPPAGTLVEPEGYLSLTPAGEAELPEHGALQDLEAVLNAVSGSRRHRIDDYAYFRDDPAAVVTFLLENPTGLPSVGEAVSSYESLALAFEKVPAFAEIRSFRVRNAFLMRLVRCHREDPKAPWLWCNRERLQSLLDLTRKAIPPSLTAKGWHAIHAVDLFLAGPGPTEVEGRLALLEAVRVPLADAFRAVPMGDGQFTRLALAMMHAAAERGFTSPALRDRFLRVMVEAAIEGRQASPQDLTDEGARHLLGFHLAHLAGFMPSRIADYAERLGRLEALLKDERDRRRLPVQVTLHALATLDRLGRSGVNPGEQAYVDTILRIRQKLRRHKDLMRAFRSDQVQDDDEAFLAANLAARAYGSDVSDHVEARRPADVGLAGLFEASDRRAMPLLGLPFGTLLIS